MNAERVCLQDRRGRWTRPLAIAFVATLVGFAPGASAQTTSEVACPSPGARETLTLGERRVDLSAPAAVAPVFGGPFAATEAIATPYHEAVFHLQADFTPVDRALMSVDLEWALPPSDYNVYVLDDEGQVIADGNDLNLLEQSTTEHLRVLLFHCDRFSVVVRNWAGAPEMPLSMHLDTRPFSKSESLECVENDPAPGCAGKAAGETPELVPDDRSFRYLGGPPGQAAMAHRAAPAGGDAIPLRGSLTADRPTTGIPNSYTHLITSSGDHSDPLVPHFTAVLAEDGAGVVGDASGLVWLSSPTLGDDGTLFVELYADGSLAATAEVSGDRVGAHPTPVFVEFPGLDLPGASSVTLQVRAAPVGEGSPEDVPNGLFTLHYGSVQFLSRIVLP